MRKNFVLLFILLGTISCVKFNSKIIGKWNSENKTVFEYFIFKENGICSIGLGESDLNGEDFNLEGKKGTINYVVNQGKKFIELDIIAKKSGSSRNSFLYGIANFKGENKLVLAFDENERPTEFNSENTIILVREK